MMNQNHNLKLAAAAIVLALACGPALTTTVAQGPPAQFEDTFTLEGICGFPVLVEIRGKEGVIALPNGSLLVTAPGEYVVLTNLNDPSRRETVSITGAFQVTFRDDGNLEFVGTGRNLIAFDDPATLVITIGTFSFTVDQDGNLVQPLTGSGRVIDVCELLS